MKVMNENIAIVSVARNDDFFIPKWVDYYGNIFGFENLFLILDGHDQKIPELPERVNIIRIPHIAMSRSEGDRNRARLVSAFARSLFYRYARVIAHDIDEFLVLDPLVDGGLKSYLLNKKDHSSVSGLGLDVGQHLDLEKEIDVGHPFLLQRSFAHVSSRYTKPVVALKPLTWGSGFHRVKGKNFQLDPNLYLFHFGMVDFARCQSKMDDSSRIAQGWTAHLDRRFKLFDIIKNNPFHSGDDYFDKARRRMRMWRPIYAWNKPGTLKEEPVIQIPDRFKNIL